MGGKEVGLEAEAEQQDQPAVMEVTVTEAEEEGKEDEAVVAVGRVEAAEVAEVAAVAAEAAETEWVSHMGRTKFNVCLKSETATAAL